jgi:peptidyl-tRNA hydrolase, PTH1 family
VLNYVLGRAGRDDEAAVIDGIDAALDAVETWLTKGWDHALNQLHSRESGSATRNTPRA